MAVKSLPYNFIGSSGIKVSNICLGTMTFGKAEETVGECDEVLSHQLLDKFAEYGGNFIDTADVYNNGLSETIVGNWLKKRDREEFVIASKVRFNTDSGNVNSIGLSRKHIIHGLEQSLERLGSHYIDLYQVHCWDAGTDIAHTLRTLHDLVRVGKVRHLGLSNVTGWQMQKLIDTSSHMGLEPFISLQAQYNLLCRQTEWELLEICTNEGLSLLPWSPLKGGWLSGKYTVAAADGTPRTPSSGEGRVGWVSEDPGRRQSQSCPSYSQFSGEPRVWRLLHTMREIAHRNGCTVSQVAIRWLLQQQRVPSVITGVRTVRQLEDNMAAAHTALTPHQMQELDKASEVPLPYPYEMVWRCQRNRLS